MPSCMAQSRLTVCSTRPSHVLETLLQMHFPVEVNVPCCCRETRKLQNASRRSRRRTTSCATLSSGPSTTRWATAGSRTLAAGAAPVPDRGTRSGRDSRGGSKAGFRRVGSRTCLRAWRATSSATWAAASRHAWAAWAACSHACRCARRTSCLLHMLCLQGCSTFFVLDVPAMHHRQISGRSRSAGGRAICPRSAGGRAIWPRNAGGHAI